MGIKYPLRAKMTTSTTGTGTITLGSAVAGYAAFADELTSSSYIKYTIEDGDNWEVGTGYFNVSSGTMTRSALRSSNSNAWINLSGNAVVFATTTRHEVASRSLLATSTFNNASSYLSYDWRSGWFGTYFTNSAIANYTNYELVLDRVTPSTDSYLYLRFNYPYTYYYNTTDTGNNYNSQYLESYGTVEYGTSLTTSTHRFNRYSLVGGGTGESGWSGTIRFLCKTYASGQRQQVQCSGHYINSSGEPITHQSACDYQYTSQNIQGFYLYTSSGNLASGRWSLYGLRDEF